MQLGEQRNVQSNPNGKGHIIGFIRRTLGGFFRGYCYGAGVGYGPFTTEQEAETWVRTTAKS